MGAKQLKEIVGLMMVGEGVMAMVHPHGYARLWQHGPSWWRTMIDPFVRHPGKTRFVGAAEAMVGFCLASRQISPSAQLAS